jgi:membrane protein DedA with SNARE-associated domain
MSKAKARYRRSIIIWILALASMVWVAVDQFDIPPEDMAWLLVYTVVVVAAIILCAAVAVAVLVGLKKLLGKTDQTPGPD